MGIKINEATSTGGSRGSYIAPLMPGERYFKKNVFGTGCSVYSNNFFRVFFRQIY